MKRALVCVVSFFVLSLPVMGNPSRSLAISGTVPHQNEVTVFSGDHLYNLQQGVQGSDIGTIVSSNNSTNGFKLSLQSMNGGKLVNQIEGRSEDNTYVDYKLTINEPSSSNLGVKTDQTLTNIDLSQTPYEIKYNENLRHPTRNAEFKLVLTTPEKDLAGGVYSDTLMVTITSL